ncbi:MAG: hypothetical protein HQK53_00560 [Oligoflexia bacterium]|nr:hypothetical protein [Oligoflexia bacterium]
MEKMRHTLVIILSYCLSYFFSCCFSCCLSLSLLATTSAPASALAPKIKAEVNKAVAKIGEEVVLTVTLITDKKLQATMPEIVGEVNGLRIIDFGEDPVKEEEGALVYKKWYKLVADLSGSYILPALESRYGANAEKKVVKTAEIFIEIQAQDGVGANTTSAKGGSNDKDKGDGDKGKAKDIRDIKNIEIIPMQFGGAQWVGIVLLIVVIAGVIFYFVYWRQRQRKAVPLPLISPWQKAFQDLRELQRSSQQSSYEAKMYYFTMSSILRTYIEEQFSLAATDMTLEEIRSQLNNKSIIDDGLKQRLLELLENCDLVKFTDLKPVGDADESIFEKAYAFVDKSRPQDQVAEVVAGTAAVAKNDAGNAARNAAGNDDEESVI